MATYRKNCYKHFMNSNTSIKKMKKNALFKGTNSNIYAGI